eukprot:6224331-Ditylum_brightwellii.AAC.1
MSCVELSEEKVDNESISSSIHDDFKESESDVELVSFFCISEAIETFRENEAQEITTGQKESVMLCTLCVNSD